VIYSSPKDIKQVGLATTGVARLDRQSQDTPTPGLIARAFSLSVAGAVSCYNAARTAGAGPEVQVNSRKNIMKHHWTLMAVLSLTLCAGCGDTHESLMDDQIGAMEEVATILEGVKDKDSAKAAKPRLEALAKRQQDIEKRVKELGEPTDEKKEQLMKVYAPRLEAVMSRMMKLDIPTDAMSELGDPTANFQFGMP
jgi:hypothetical protein